MPGLDVEKFVANYIKRAPKGRFKSGALGTDHGSYRDISIMAFWDKNLDGIITKEEFYSKSKEEYQEYKKSLFEIYNKKFKDNNTSTDINIRDYEDLEKFYNNKGYFGIFELKQNTDKQLLEYNNNIEEVKHKESPVLDEEMKHRQQINAIDKNSNRVDWHVGTFSQGTIVTCVLLSAINLMSDEELQALYSQKTDENGEIYYEVNFPQDKRRKPVKVTEKELNNGYIQYSKKLKLAGFSFGDKDVTLIEMAYIKRYGKSIAREGTENATVMTRMFNKSVKNYDDNPSKKEKALQRNEHALANLIDTETLKLNYRSRNKNELDLSKGKNKDNIAKILAHPTSGRKDALIQLPNGQNIYTEHVYSITNYDSEKREVTIVNPHDNSTDIKIPLDTFKVLFELCQ